MGVEEWGLMSNYNNFMIKKFNPFNVIVEGINEYMESLCDDGILSLPQPPSSSLPPGKKKRGQENNDY